MYEQTYLWIYDVFEILLGFLFINYLLNYLLLSQVIVRTRLLGFLLLLLLHIQDNQLFELLTLLLQFISLLVIRISKVGDKPVSICNSYDSDTIFVTFFSGSATSHYQTARPASLHPWTTHLCRYHTHHILQHIP